MFLVIYFATPLTFLVWTNMQQQLLGLTDQTLQQDIKLGVLFENIFVTKVNLVSSIANSILVKHI